MPVPVLNSSVSNTTLSGPTNITTVASISTSSVNISNSSSANQLLLQQQQQQQQIPYQYHIRSSLSGNLINNCGITAFNVGPNNSLRTAVAAAVLDNNMDTREHNQHHIRQLLSGGTGVNIVFDENNFQGQTRPELYQKCNRGSHSSDTSSAYSGSDTMTSVHSSSLDADEVDLSGLVESVVDSDEDDLAESMDVS